MTSDASNQFEMRDRMRRAQKLDEHWIKFRDFISVDRLVVRVDWVSLWSPDSQRDKMVLCKFFAPVRQSRVEKISFMHGWYFNVFVGDPLCVMMRHVGIHPQISQFIRIIYVYIFLFHNVNLSSRLRRIQPLIAHNQVISFLSDRHLTHCLACCEEKYGSSCALEKILRCWAE